MAFEIKNFKIHASRGMLGKKVTGSLPEQNQINCHKIILYLGFIKK